MNIIAVINQKGGVGKTTLASTLAVLAHMDGFSTAMLDTDLQAGLARWHQDRQQFTGRPEPRLLVANDENDPGKVRRAVKAAQKAGVEWLFIDTAAGIARLQVVAAEVADLILIPCSPSKRDQIGTVPSVQLAKQHGKKAFFVINKGSQSKAINDATATGLSSALGLPTVSAHIVRRQPTVESEQTGEALPELESKEASVARGQAEFRELWSWMKRQFSKQEMAAHV